MRISGKSNKQIAQQKVLEIKGLIEGFSESFGQSYFNEFYNGNVSSRKEFIDFFSYSYLYNYNSEY